MRRSLILLLLLPFALACLPAASATPASPTLLVISTSSVTSTEPPSAYTGLNLQTLDAYRAVFGIHFEGAYSWTYWLETRTNGGAVAYNLRIEGVDASMNPGDVRVVVEGDIARMRGPATDDACVQFPSDLDLGRSFLSPDDLISPQVLQAALRPLGAETVAGAEAVHYTLRQASLGDWQDVEVDIWREDATGVVLRYNLRMTREDPLFDAGEGVLSGYFEVIDIDPQTIEPITGCEVDLPLPPDATRLVRMPGLVAFESATAPAEIVAFYQAALVEVGWEPLGEPESGLDAVLLSYRRDGQTLDVNVESREAGTHVELLLGDEW